MALVEVGHERAPPDLAARHLKEHALLPHGEQQRGRPDLGREAQARPDEVVLHQQEALAALGKLRRPDAAHILLV